MSETEVTSKPTNSYKRRQKISIFLFLLVLVMGGYMGYQVYTGESRGVFPYKKGVNYISAEDFLSHMMSEGGHVHLVNLWATWCEPCVKEIPDLLRLQNEFYEKGLRVHFISMDEPPLKGKVHEFISELGYEKPYSWMKSPEAPQFLTRLSGGSPLAVLPQTLVFSGPTQPVDVWGGILSYDEMLLEVRAILE